MVRQADVKFITGYNMPGYLPEAKPSDPLSWTEAVDSIIEDLEHARDSMTDGIGDTDGTVMRYNDAIHELENTGQGEWLSGEMPDGLVYWISESF